MNLHGPQLWETPPHFVNEKGIQWWNEKDLTHYARSKGFKDVAAWIVKFPDGKMNRVLTRNNEVIYEDPTLEGIACHIEAMWMANLKD